MPVHTLVERRIRLASLLPEDGARLEKGLDGTRTVDEAIDVLERFLIQRLSDIQIDRVFGWHSNELKNAVVR